MGFIGEIENDYHFNGKNSDFHSWNEYIVKYRSFIISIGA